MSITRYQESARMSQAVCFGPHIETAGQVAHDTTQGIQGQTQQALAAIDALLAEVGASKEHLTRIQIWLADMDDFSAMNEVYEQWLNGAGKPVRACVGSQLVSGGYLIEVQAFAYRA